MRAALSLVLILLLAACLPPFAPSPGTAPGVTFTRAPTATGWEFVLLVEEPYPAVRETYVRLVGEDLASEQCEGDSQVLRCTSGVVVSEWRLLVEGRVLNSSLLPFGVVCREECFDLYLTSGP